MDRSGAMPRSAWIEIRDPEGELLASIPARINGGTVTADLPTFPPETKGSIELCADEEPIDFREERRIQDLPTRPLMFVCEMG
ncbi:MAG: hypothetical protein ACRDLL_02680 [Solirubrobacterales bacterium]